jgi:hypothetical protein
MKLLSLVGLTLAVVWLTAAVRLENANSLGMCSQYAINDPSSASSAKIA